MGWCKGGSLRGGKSIKQICNESGASPLSKTGPRFLFPFPFFLLPFSRGGKDGGHGKIRGWPGAWWGQAGRDPVLGAGVGGRWGEVGSVKGGSKALCAVMGARRGRIDCACVERQWCHSGIIVWGWVWAVDGWEPGGLDGWDIFQLLIGDLAEDLLYGSGHDTGSMMLKHPDVQIFAYPVPFRW